ncbi:helix-turn-helix transcriptional regulator [Natronobacterium texcoconense]|uniref:Predicted transcriptional regulator, contains HTH domain n=1 Tax=Natronobacterium texcoconense TaxID=1095778 RepID=A0A1H1BBV5_NATTX|nr:MarR family transcriptional regulator [Natronobacterium texcoconense]SDQ48836.1 Predicted transcriptional regulator, contains HTH domain [Natronobacterium texcoconense]
MGVDNARHYPSDSPTGDIAYLARSEHRIPALVALTERPRSRSELCELTGVSSSTMRRTLDEFDDRVWIRKDGYQYLATRLGEAIAAGMEDLIERVETERKLRDVWDWLPDEISELSTEAWADLTVTTAEPDAPYRPVNRFESLLRTTTTLRFLRPEVALMEPCLDLLYRLIDDGVDVTLIDRPNCHTYFLSTYPDRSSEMLQQDNFTVLEHDKLPQYGTGLLDERVAISCYEQDSGTVQAVIDTDVPVVREWAESVYESYTSDARPVDPQQIVE